MDSKEGFERALEQYRQVYVQVGLARQPYDSLAEPRNQIMNAIGRLQNLVDSESREIRDFSKDQHDREMETTRLVEKSQNLESEFNHSRDELERTKRLVGETPPPPDFSPLYARIGIITGLFVLVVGIQIAKTRM